MRRSLLCSHIGSLINCAGGAKPMLLHCKMGAFARQERPSYKARTVLLQGKSIGFARLKSVYLCPCFSNQLINSDLEKRPYFAYFGAREKFFRISQGFSTFCQDNSEFLTFHKALSSLTPGTTQFLLMPNRGKMGQYAISNEKLSSEGQILSACRRIFSSPAQ